MIFFPETCLHPSVPFQIGFCTSKYNPWTSIVILGIPSTSLSRALCFPETHVFLFLNLRKPLWDHRVDLPVGSHTVGSFSAKVLGRHFFFKLLGVWIYHLYFLESLIPLISSPLIATIINSTSKICPRSVYFPLYPLHDHHSSQSISCAHSKPSVQVVGF